MLQSLKESWVATTRALSGRFDDYRVILNNAPIPLGNLQIPCDVSGENKVLLSLSVFRLASNCLTSGSFASTSGRNTTNVGTFALTGALGLVHLDGLTKNRANASLHRVSLNPYRVVEKGEYYRLITSQVYSSSTTSFMTHLADIVESASVIESAWGTWDMLASMVSASIIGQVLYVGLSKIARVYYPEFGIAKEFYRYSTGLSITSIGARTLSGYVLDEQESKASKMVTYKHRYGWSMHLLLTNTLLRLSAGCMAADSSPLNSYAALEAPSLFAVGCGLATGVALGVLGTPSLSKDLWMVFVDVALQGLLLTGCAMTYGPEIPPV
jgi:hypothetical protein